MREQHSTVYLNHAGTSWPKPAPVLEAIENFPSIDPAAWPQLFATGLRTVADFFHVDPSRLLLTPSCTAALSLAIADLPWGHGDRVLTSHYEHHALHRPLVKLRDRDVQVSTLPPAGHELVDLEALEAELKCGKVRLVAVTAACNVTGQLLPVAELIRVAHEHDAAVLIDGAQLAGWTDLDLVALGADLFAFAGHKGPQAPWGIGGLYVSPQVIMKCLRASCEVSVGGQAAEFATMPGYCDAGSVNLQALAGLAAACQYFSQSASPTRLHEARQLAKEFTDAIRGLPQITIHGDVAVGQKMPTVALTVGQKPSAELAKALRAVGLITSGGHQCAALAHQALGTEATGVVRFSFGMSNQGMDVEAAVRGLAAVIGR